MRRNQFEQQFQDSEANFSEVVPQRADDRSDGHPVQLLRVLHNGKIEIAEQALNIIASCSSQISFVSVVGKMRTGKSCLLNRLLGLTGKGFKVDPATSSCTEGIWMWSQPRFSPTLNCFVFFLDTEGTNSLQKNPQVDAKIMTLSLLISSYFVFNSIGNIDERSISELQMVTALSQHVRADQKLTERQNQQQLYKYMPKFIWALRDFTLKIEDSKGRKITPTQYLENCLNDQQPGAIDQHSRKIKKSLLNYFKIRQCITFVRPVGDQYELQRLNTIPDHALRRQFIDAVSNLREKLIKGCEPKKFGGQPVNGPLMADLIDSFVQTFNSNKVPSIRSAWQQVAEDEGASAFNAAIVKYQDVFREQFPNDDPKSDEQMRKILTRLREESMKEFDAYCYNQKQDQYKVKLKQLFQQKQANIIEINRNVCEARNNEILKRLAQKIKTKIQNGSYSGKKQDMQTDLDDVIAKYNIEAKGATKAEILAEFIRNITPLMFSLDEGKAKQDEQLRKAKIKQDENQKIKKLHEKEIESLKLQLAAKEKPMPLPAPKVGRGGDKPPQKESQGCCSGDKCIIM